MKRYEIERAVQRAQMPGPSVAIMHVLCTRIHAESGIIPPGAQPSLNSLAAMAGYSRSTIVRHLGKLERTGWVTRVRPPAWLARTRHATTAYAMHVPIGFPQARRRGEPALGAQRAEARTAEEQELGARDAEARAAALRNTEVSTEETKVIDRGAAGAAADDDIQLRRELEKAAADELRQLTGKTISNKAAAAAVRLVLDGRKVRDPRAYLIKALRDDPQRYVPKSSGPPQFRDGRFIDQGEE